MTFQEAIAGFEKEAAETIAKRPIIGRVVVTTTALVVLCDFEEAASAAELRAFARQALTAIAGADVAADLMRAGIEAAKRATEPGGRSAP